MTHAVKNDRLLRAIRREPVDMTPIWLMRQAGRYLPEYRAVRQQARSFLTLCKTPELACQVTLQPLARFPLDAAILFSDILTIPDAMGLGLSFQEGEGPLFQHPIRSARDILRLAAPDPESSLSYVLETIRMIQQELAGKVPLIGFCGSPWTLACYMVEGKANRDFPLIQTLREKEPSLLHQLLDVLTRSVTLHLEAQIQAGVQAVMLFDSWGGILNTMDYPIYSLAYLRTIIITLKKRHSVPIILFTKGGGQWLNIMAQSGCDVIGIDWLTSLCEARKEVGNSVALQGNMNPELLYQSTDRIHQEVLSILESYGHGSGHIFNLGHGMIKDINPDRVAFLVDTVHTLSQPYHS